MSGIPAWKLDDIDFEGLELGAPFDELFGEISPRASIIIWGEPGGGKSTLALALCNELARYERIHYWPAEEGISKELASKVDRLNARHPRLSIYEWTRKGGLEAVKERALEEGAGWICLDSITKVDPGTEEALKFAEWAWEKDIGLVVVAQSTKKGRHRGSQELLHELRVEIEVTKDGVAEARKNRYAPDNSIEVPFSTEDMPRENPITPVHTSLGEIADLHSIRGVKRLNSYVGYRHGCMAARHPGEDPDAKLSFRVTKQDETQSREKQWTVEMLMDEEVVDEACSTESQADAIETLIRRHEDLELKITGEEHARKALTAEEYDRRETERATDTDLQTGDIDGIVANYRTVTGVSEATEEDVTKHAEIRSPVNRRRDGKNWLYTRYLVAGDRRIAEYDGYAAGWQEIEDELGNEAWKAMDPVESVDTEEAEPAPQFEEEETGGEEPDEPERTTEYRVELLAGDPPDETTIRDRATPEVDTAGEVREWAKEWFEERPDGEGYRIRQIELENGIRQEEKVIVESWPSLSEDEEESGPDEIPEANLKKAEETLGQLNDKLDEALA